MSLGRAVPKSYHGSSPPPGTPHDATFAVRPPDRSFRRVPPRPAKITSPVTLEQLVKDQPLIFTAKVTEFLPDKPGMVLAPVDKLRGEFPFERVPVNLTGDKEAIKEKQPAVLLERLDKDVPLVIFAARDGRTLRRRRLHERDVDSAGRDGGQGRRQGCDPLAVPALRDLLPSDVQGDDGGLDQGDPGRPEGGETARVRREGGAGIRSAVEEGEGREEGALWPRPADQLCRSA